MLCLAHIIDKVQNHPCHLNEWKTKYEVHHNIRTSSNKEGGFIAILGHAQKKDLKPDQQLHRDGYLVGGCNDAREDDRCVVIGDTNGLDVRVLLDDRLHVIMEVGGAQQCAGAEHAAQRRAVLLFLGAAHLQHGVRHWAVDSNRNLCLEDYVERTTTT